MDERDRDRDDVWNAASGGGDDEPDFADPRAGDPAADLASMGVITVGDLLSTASRAVGASFLPFVAIAVLVLLPAIGLGVATNEWVMHRMQQFVEDPLAPGALDMTMWAAVVNLGAIMVKTVFGFLAQATLMYATVEYMAGRRAGIGQSLAGGFSSIGSVLGLSILNTVAIGLASLACLIPGIVVMCVLFASVPAAVVERLGPIEAMQRSSDLTAGHRMTIFLAVLVVWLVSVTFGCTANLAVEVGNGSLGGAAIPSLPQRLMSYGVEWAITIPVTIFQAALAAVFYARVRGVRDGVDADSIAKEFE